MTFIESTAFWCLYVTPWFDHGKQTEFTDCEVLSIVLKQENSHFDTFCQNPVGDMVQHGVKTWNVSKFPIQMLSLFCNNPGVLYIFQLGTKEDLPPWCPKWGQSYEWISPWATGSSGQASSDEHLLTFDVTGNKKTNPSGWSLTYGLNFLSHCFPKHHRLVRACLDSAVTLKFFRF